MTARSKPLPTVPTTPGVATLIDELLADQRRLTAVERFTQKHAEETQPALEGHYRSLIPLTAPRPGEQYGFEVDLDRCTGCKGCVTACHALNGLDEDESWRRVGFLVGETLLPLGPDTGSPSKSTHPPGADRPHPIYGNRVIPLQQVVTTACHHCLEPACLTGCPVLAYDKDPVTGIVRHLDDQCIGCSYCILKCPYEVPQYSARLGIVRKCDLCHGRLEAGEAPACVQACPNEAIRIRLVDRAAVRQEWESTSSSQDSAGPTTAWLPDAPEPDYTLPTTRYTTRRSGTTLLAADHHRVTPASPHWPLVFMLVLTQMGLGGLIAGALGSTAVPLRAGWVALSGYGLFWSGLAASAFHLGQPRKAWRIWLGWRTSWLSREAIALNLIAGLTLPLLPLLTFALWSSRSGWPAEFGAWIPPWMTGSPWLWGGFLTGLTGLGVATQTMVYADTRREFWRGPRTASRFFGTTLLAVLVSLELITGQGVFAVALLLAVLVKASVEFAVFQFAENETPSRLELQRSARLLGGPLRGVWALRVGLGFAGGVALPLGIALSHGSLSRSCSSAALLALGELTERYLFFRAAAPKRMPGQPA